MSDNHKLAELTAYVYGEGTPKERAAFEAHLETCPECQADLLRLERLLPQAHAQLRKPPDTSVEGMMRLMERAERELKTGLRERETRRRPWMILAGATLALAVAALVAVLLLRPPPKSKDIVTAPPRPAVDGG